MIPKPLRSLALLLALAAPAAAQELRLSAHRAGRTPAVSIGYSDRHGLRADLRFGSTRPVQRTVQRRSACRVWVDGHWDREWIEPVYQLRRQSCGSVVRVLVQQGHWRKVWRPGYWSSTGARHGSIRRAY